MSISVTVDCIHPEGVCSRNNKGKTSFIRVLDVKTLEEAQKVIDERANLGKLLCEICGKNLLSPIVCCDM